MMHVPWKIIRQILRGCRHLPHAGPHPGTRPLVAIIAAISTAGFVGGGPTGGFIDTLMATLVNLPLYLYGSYHRARFEEQVACLEHRPAAGSRNIRTDTNDTPHQGGPDALTDPDHLRAGS